MSIVFLQALVCAEQANPLTSSHWKHGTLITSFPQYLVCPLHGTRACQVSLVEGSLRCGRHYPSRTGAKREHPPTEFQATSARIRPIPGMHVHRICHFSSACSQVSRHQPAERHHYGSRRMALFLSFPISRLGKNDGL